MQRSDRDILVIIGLSLPHTAIGIIHYTRHLYGTTVPLEVPNTSHTIIILSWAYGRLVSPPPP
jgi:hypothetical protein